MRREPAQRENNNDDDKHFDGSPLAVFCMPNIRSSRVSRNSTNPELKRNDAVKDSDDEQRNQVKRDENKREKYA